MVNWSLPVQLLARPGDGKTMIFTFQKEGGEELGFFGPVRPLGDWLGQHKDRPLR